MNKFSASLICFFCFTLHVANAQSYQNDRETKARVTNWDNASSNYSITKIDEKWKDESAVIIARTNYLEYRKVLMSNQVQSFHHFHERIKLQDQKAVNKYAEFIMSSTRREGSNSFYHYGGFKIIKPDGTEIIRTQKDAVKESVSSGYQKASRLKLALPNLEVGDILDYYLDTEKLAYASTYHGFETAMFQLSNQYPLLHYRLEFDVMRKCYISFKSVNGAPELKLKEGEDKKKYYLEAKNLQKKDELKWFYGNRELPTVKFKVAYASNTAVSPFLGQPGELKTKVTQDEIASLMRRSYGIKYIDKSFKKGMRKAKKTIPDQSQWAREAYYRLRNTTAVDKMESYIMDDESYIRGISWYHFLGQLSYFYRSNKIPHSLILSVPRSIATVDDIILEEELSMIMKVRTKDPFFVGSFSNSALINEIDSELEGQKGFTFQANFLPTSCYLAETTIPISPADSNAVYTELDLSLAGDSLQIGITRTISGHGKIDYQSKLLSAEDIILDEKGLYGIDEIHYSTSSDIRAAVAQRNENMKRFKEHREKALKKSYASEFDLEIESMDHLTIVETGRLESGRNMTYTVDCVTKDAIKKIGPNYLIEVGRFIGQQTKIDQEYRERSHDIYMPYARQYSETIRFAIPEGYEVSGAEKLNMNIENETGRFISSSSIIDGKLEINAIKQYNHNFEPQENWPLMLKFLDAAAAFYDSKILLKKI